MFSRLRGFLYRHRRKFFLGGILFGSAIFLSRFTQRKIREWQEKEIKELLDRSKRQQHFEATERTCDQTILNLASSLRRAVVSTINTEVIVEQLQNGCDNKLEAWNKLKVLAFSKTTVIIYSYAMLVATMRVQVNLIGGYYFRDLMNRDKVLREDTSQKYLSLSSHFMKEGIEKLCEYVNEQVQKVTGNISLKDELTLRDVEQVYWSIVSNIMMDPDKDPIRNLAKYIMCPQDDDDELIKKMTKETVDLLSSTEVRHLIQNTIASGFHVIVDHISDYFETGNKTANSDPVPGPSTAKDTVWQNQPCQSGLFSFTTARKPMAKIIPILNGQLLSVAKKGDMASDWLQILIFNEKYKALGANVYDAFNS